jgi:hypothetical protein
MKDYFQNVIILRFLKQMTTKMGIRSKAFLKIKEFYKKSQNILYGNY